MFAFVEMQNHTKFYDLLYFCECILHLILDKQIGTSFVVFVTGRRFERTMGFVVFFFFLICYPTCSDNDLRIYINIPLFVDLFTKG